MTSQPLIHCNGIISGVESTLFIRLGDFMNINASIIDQRLLGVMNDIRAQAEEELNLKNDDGRLKSLAFIYLCVNTLLDLDPEETFECLTDGGGDFGVDAIYIGEEMDGEFVVTLFQAKYKQNLEANAEYPENAINDLVNAISHIFNPSSDLGAINDRLKTKVETARSIIQGGTIPQIRAVACNNGMKWNSNAEQAIIRSGFGEQVVWEHVNHDGLMTILQRTKPVDATLRLVGKAVVEDMNFSRVCVGRIPVTEIADLMKANGERLLERNIRRYLGLNGNRVNEGIRSTLEGNNAHNFYFFNNGLTFVCNDFSYNAIQKEDYQIRVENLQIVNGGQTSMTILKTIEAMRQANQPLPHDASVLVRIYKLPKDNEDIVLQITHATNSQNPVDLKDLRSNDEKQRQLETDIQSLGYTYRRKRMDSVAKRHDITSGVAAEAILSVWRGAPHQAKFLTREHFGKLYHKIFTASLNGTQAVIAVLLYRIAETRRKKTVAGDPEFVRYASCFIAMQMGKQILKAFQLSQVEDLTHKNFNEVKKYIEQYSEALFNTAMQDVETALKALYGDRALSMQQLSATFRRGDLIAILGG